MIGRALTELNIQKAVWYLDSPVSNSGRLKTMICSLFRNCPFENEVQLVRNPDNELAAADHCIATSDSAILDQCKQWFNLSACLVEHLIQQGMKCAWIDLSKSV